MPMPTDDRSWHGEGEGGTKRASEASMEARAHRPQPVSLAGEPALGPYSDAMRVGDLLFLSGRIGIDRSTLRLVDGGVGAQTRRSLANIADVLASAGASLRDVVRATVYLTDMGGFAEMNEAYGETFDGWKPARTAVAVAALPMGALVEIEVVAAVA